MLLLLLGKVVNDQIGFGVSGMLFMHNFLKSVEALYIMNLMFIGPCVIVITEE